MCQKKMSREERFRSWVFTINNYDEDQKVYVRDELFLRYGLTYLVVGDETGAEGTPHLQGYLRFKHGKTASAVQECLNPGHQWAGAWHKNANGSGVDSKVYCSKEHLLVELGVVPASGPKVSPSTRGTSFERFRRDAERGAPGMWEKHTATLIKHHSGASACIAHYMNMHIKPDPIIIVAWGGTGTGKSRWACDSFGRDAATAYWVTPGHGRIWWGGYTQQRVVVFDDFTPENLPVQHFKLLCDRYAYRVEPKGSQVAFTSKYIVFTSNEDPRRWYRNPDITDETKDVHWQAVQRRLGLLRKHPNPNANVVFFDGVQQHINFALLPEQVAGEDDDSSVSDDSVTVAMSSSSVSESL